MESLGSQSQNILSLISFENFEITGATSAIWIISTLITNGLKKTNFKEFLIGYIMSIIEY